MPALIAGASKRLSALTWGAEDLSAELGAENNRDGDGRLLDPYRLARALCLAGAAAAGVPAIDTVYIDFRDIEAFRRECEAGAPRRLFGKDGHPSGAGADHQRAVHADAGSDAQAQAIVDAFAASPDTGVVGIDGLMFDRPHLTRAKRLLARAHPPAKRG